MSISRSKLAERLNISESDVKCENCRNAKNCVQGMYFCEILKGRKFEEDFCQLFVINTKKIK